MLNRLAVKVTLIFESLFWPYSSMRKSDKKLDNQLRKSLTDFCEHELKNLNGFQWLTHSVKYPNVSSSLNIVCVFETNDQLQRFMSSSDKQAVESSLKSLLQGLNVKLSNFNQQLVFDTEENCNQFNQGNWAKRLA